MTATAAAATENIIAGLRRRDRNAFSSRVFTAAAMDVGGGGIGRDAGAAEGIAFSPGAGGADPGIAARIVEALVGGGGGGAEGRWLDPRPIGGGGGGAADGRNPGGGAGIAGAGALGIGRGGGGAKGAPAAGKGALRAVSASSAWCLSKMAVFSSSSSQSMSIELVDACPDGATGGKGDVIGIVGVSPNGGAMGGLPGTEGTGVLGPADAAIGGGAACGRLPPEGGGIAGGGNGGAIAGIDGGGGGAAGIDGGGGGA